MEVGYHSMIIGFILYRFECSQNTCWKSMFPWSSTILVLYITKEQMSVTEIIRCRYLKMFTAWLRKKQKHNLVLKPPRDRKPDDLTGFHLSLEFRITIVWLSSLCCTSECKSFHSFEFVNSKFNMNDNFRHVIFDIRIDYRNQTVMNVKWQF